MIEKLRYTGSFFETLNAGNTAHDTDFNSTTIVPVGFGGIVDHAINGMLGSHGYSRRVFDISRDYWTGVSFKLLSLSAFSELPSKLLAGFVDISDDDSDAQKTQKLLDNYSRFQKVGLKLWAKLPPIWRGNADVYSNDQWLEAGETVLQNKGIQMKINLLPYLGVQNFNMSGSIGFEIVDKGNGRLGSGDYVRIIGEWETEITLAPLTIGYVNVIPTLSNGN